MISLPSILSLIKNEEDMNNMLCDLLTPQEKKAVEDRWKIANLLYQGKLSYLEIAEKLGTSTTTVTRVARFLNNEQYGGYRKALELQKDII